MWKAVRIIGWTFLFLLGVGALLVVGLAWAILAGLNLFIRKLLPLLALASPIALIAGGLILGYRSNWVMDGRLGWWFISAALGFTGAILGGTWIVSRRDV